MHKPIEHGQWFGQVGSLSICFNSADSCAILFKNEKTSVAWLAWQ